MLSSINSTGASGLALLTQSAARSAQATATSDPISTSNSGGNASFVLHVSGASVMEAAVNFQINQSEGSASDQSMATMIDAMAHNNELSSQQISQAMYSGGLTDPAAVGTVNDGVKDTLQKAISINESIANYESAVADTLGQWMAAGRPEGDFTSSNVTVGADTFVTMTADAVAFFNQNYSDAQIQSMMAQDNADAATAHQQDAGIMQAFKDGALSIQKAADVTALNYSETDIWRDFGNGGSETGVFSWNSAALATSADGTQHTLVNVGAVELYLSWNDKSDVPASPAK